MEYDNELSGALFKNDYKKSDKAPDFRGPFTLNGKEMEIAAWARQSKSGKKFLSVKVSEPYKKSEGSTESNAFQEDAGSDW